MAYNVPKATGSNPLTTLLICSESIACASGAQKGLPKLYWVGGNGQSIGSTVSDDMSVWPSVRSAKIYFGVVSVQPVVNQVSVGLSIVFLSSVGVSSVGLLSDHWFVNTF